jgi:RHS repeat-associated protein
MSHMPVATLQPNGSSVAIYYVHTDHLGTPRKNTRPPTTAEMIATWIVATNSMAPCLRVRKASRGESEQLERPHKDVRSGSAAEQDAKRRGAPDSPVPGECKDSTNSPARRRTWDPDTFGSVNPNTNPSDFGAFNYNLRFPGQYSLNESGLYYNYFRDYDPQMGRYVESDPLGLAAGVNTYAYVRSNAVSRIDSNGLLDVFIGGAMDGTTRIVASYQQAYGLAHSNRSSLYFEWGQASNVIDAVRRARGKNKCEPINIVGHSYGGSTASSVSRKLKAAGIDVNLLVTVDPVSRIWSRGSGAASSWVDINAAPGSSNGFSGDTWAALGGKWGSWPDGKANSYYEAPYHHNEFEDLFEFAPAGGKSALQALLDSDSSCTCQ